MLSTMASYRFHYIMFLLSETLLSTLTIRYRGEDKVFKFLTPTPSLTEQVFEKMPDDGEKILMLF